MPNSCKVYRGACVNLATTSGLSLFEFSIVEDTARLYFYLSFSLSSFSLLELLSSVPDSVVMFPASFSYLSPLMCQVDGDRLITTYPNFDQISTTNRLYAVFSGSYEIPCFDERNKHGAELQVHGADGVIDVFVWSFSVPNGRAATHHTAASILLPTQLLLHTEFCSGFLQPPECDGAT